MKSKSAFCWDLSKWENSMCRTVAKSACQQNFIAFGHTLKYFVTDLICFLTISKLACNQCYWKWMFGMVSERREFENVRFSEEPWDRTIVNRKFHIHRRMGKEKEWQLDPSHSVWMFCWLLATPLLGVLESELKFEVFQILHALSSGQTCKYH